MECNTRGTFVADLNTIVSLIGSCSRGTESLGTGLQHIMYISLKLEVDGESAEHCLCTHEQTDGRTKSKHNAFAAHLTLMVGRQKSIQRSNVQSFKDPKIWLLPPTPFASKPVSTSYLTGSFTPSVSPLGTTGLPAHFTTVL